mmetsp:Transcript_78339/g.229597  ORF Transcript_78339/g.229597 Transcript_78339/m.229597 type:complete len:540 (-) Transcript_78339:8-1627(-)
MNPWHSSYEVLADPQELALPLELALVGGGILNGVQQLLPLHLQLLFLLRAAVRDCLKALELTEALLRVPRLMLGGLARGLLSLLEFHEAALEVLLPSQALAPVVLRLRALGRRGRDLVLQLARCVAVGGRDALGLALDALKLLALFLCEAELALGKVVSQRLLLALKFCLLISELLKLGLGPASPALHLRSVAVEVLDALLQEVDARAGSHPLRVHLVELGAGRHDGALGLRGGQVRLRTLPLRPLQALAAALHGRAQLLTFGPRRLPLAPGLIQLPRDAVEPEEVELLLQISAFGLQAPVGVGLILLLDHPLLLIDSVALLREEVPGIVLLLGLLCRQTLVLLAEGLRAGDLFEEGREVLALALGRGLHVALEDQEVARLGQDVDRFQSLVVICLRDGLSIDLEASLASAHDHAPEDKLGLLILHFALAHKRKLDRGCALILLGILALLAVDKVAKLLTSQHPRLDSQHEAYGVHEVGLASTVGADDTGEVPERADLDAALVGLEILDDDLVDASHGAGQMEVCGLARWGRRGTSSPC